MKLKNALIAFAFLISAAYSTQAQKKSQVTGKNIKKMDVESIFTADKNESETEFHEMAPMADIAGLDITPNPFPEKGKAIKIKSVLQGTSFITIANTNGKVVYAAEVMHSDELVIRKDTFTRGHYLLSILDFEGNKLGQERLVIE